MSWHVGEDIGPYRIVSILGAGSMGQVYQVEHQITKHREAIKVLLADVASDSQFLRFMREIEVQGRLNHPNIARVRNALHLKDSLILVMELVEGQSLEKLLRKGRLPICAGVDYICQTLSGLQYAHARGVVHRDVTPGNLIITPHGIVKLTDFGLAKSVGDYQLTNDGDMVGSLFYMPPEQVRHHSEPDPRSDVYSVGAVLYEILTGKKLFEFTDRLSLMVAHVQREPVPPIDIEPGIGPKLNAIVLKALSKDPGQRYQSAEEFRVALQRAGRSPGFTPRLASSVRVATLALAVCAIAETVGLEKIPLQKPVAPAVEAAVSAAVEAPVEAPAAPRIEAAPRKPRIKTASPMPRIKTATAMPRIKAAGEMPQVETAAVSALNSESEMTAPSNSEPSVEPQHEPQLEPQAEPQPSVPHKRGFWSKLNPFKRKKSNRPD